MKNEGKVKGAKVNDAKEEALKDMINGGNIFNALNEVKTLSKAKGSKGSTLYKDEVYNELNDKDKKKLRRIARHKRNAFAKDIIFLNDELKALKVAKDKKAKKEELSTLINSFNKFYAMIYKLNDLSFNSLSAKNNDDDTYVLINNMLIIIKAHKA